MRIQNFETLANTAARRAALTIAEAGLNSIDTTQATANAVAFDPLTQRLVINGQLFELARYKTVTCIGFGKASLDAVSELQKILGSKINCGFVLDMREGEIEGITCKVGTHPYPTLVNVKATQELIAMVGSLSEEDLVLCVVSGGGSSLLCYPADLSCEEETSIIAALTVKGASIQEMNTVRKHISKVKGGNLAKICYPATVISLIFSDVPGNDLGMVASGPTVRDTTTKEEAGEIMSKYDVLAMCQLPACTMYETPKEEKYFEYVHNIMIVSADVALRAMQQSAEDLGYRTKIWNGMYSGDAEVIGPRIIKAAAEQRLCLLGAGESTVQIRNPKGVGGRNQHLALAALARLTEQQVLACIASDGRDNGEHAGVIADQATRAHATVLGLDPAAYLEQNNATEFFQKTGGLIETGVTGANISDFFVCITE